ncbi:DNA glycosylase [Artemisia annua]|uniref:DNA glycosylase n=1 Tax=Artemisia annua TaxID=35608 RepID=A0A2U1LAD4_ARTAN|nr:DNA glycosylase [Artemisia annua]
MESGVSMERDGNWIPLTPGKPISGMSDDNCESMLTSKQGAEKENINEKFPFMGAFDTMVNTETIPATPAKPIPGRSRQSCETVLISEQVIEKENISGELPCMLNETCELTADINDGHESVSGVTGKDFTSTAATQYDASSVQEEAVKIPTSECDGKKAHSGDESPVDKGSIPTPSKTKESRKRHNDGIDMNKKAKQKPRMKKHRPKVYDESKPKKPPKAQTPKRSIPKPRPPKTPKPATPNRVQEKKKNSDKNKSSCMQSSTTCGFGDVARDIEEASTASIITADSCKRSLNFDDHIAKESNLVSKSHEEPHHIAKESNLVSKSHEEPPRLEIFVGDFYNFGKIVTSKRNTPRRSRFLKKSLEASEDLLGDISATRNQDQADGNGRKYIHVYQRRKKINLNATSLTPALKVYRRMIKENKCLQFSKRCGPVFPKLYKKQRSLRKRMKIHRWCDKADDVGKSSVRRSIRKPVPINRKTIQNAVNKPIVKKKVVKPNIYTEEWLRRVFSPPRRIRSVIRYREVIGDLNSNQTMPYDDDDFLYCHEENFLQIPECLPLQEVPALRIESFTSIYSDFLRVDNLKWFGLRELREVPVIQSRSLVPDNEETSDTDEGLISVDKETIEILTRKLASLDIDYRCKELMVLENNVSGALVKRAYKKRKFTPKVDLDNESLRVWTLLMENDGSEPVEEMDEQREEWWETQRNIFRGRVDSFIAKMHLIQGNRRFSPWKGSVTDSVVGVYLTQNTNDHLSSSAFMCVAARYPRKIRTKELTFQDEFTASQESVASNTKIYEGFSKNNEIEQDLDLCISLPDVSHASQTTDPMQDKPCVNEFATSQESVASNTKVDEGFSKNNEIEQYLDLCPSCPDVSDASQTTDLVQEKLCVNEDSNTFRKHLEVEEGDYLKQFCGSPLNESRVDEEEQKTDSFEFPCSHEPSVTTFDLNVSFCETSESEFIGQIKSTPEEPKVVTPICTLQSEVAIEGVNNHQSLRDMPLETKSTGKKKNRVEENQEPQIDWEELRKSYCEIGEKEVNENHMDTVDWDAVRLGTREELAKTIVERGMSNILAGRIKDFLDRMHKEHGSHDLEWLRDIPPDKAKEFLLSIQGIGLKSVECIRLLTLHHLAFPVDTNVGRVATRLGWVPLQPLPGIPIHLLNAYPNVDTIQKYLFPRLCTLDQKTLYELHYQLITFGKVFCTKRDPNCNACPMRAECRHYASAFASRRLAISGSKESSTVTTIIPAANEQSHSMYATPPSMHFDQEVNNSGSTYYSQTCEPIIEVPPSPEPEAEETLPIVGDIEDLFCEPDDDEEIPIIRLNTDEFKETLKETIDTDNINLPEADMSRALVSSSAKEAPDMHMPKKFVVKLRTMHIVFELPDFHPCLAGFEARENDDPTPYLLAVTFPGEIRPSLEYTRNRVCISDDNQEGTVKATVLIPCRTATRGSFPLNGTYFQVNEVFADDETSHVPLDVPRSQLRNLEIRELGCGLSATSIFKALSTGAIQRLFWKGSICVRGFNRKTRKPRPLHRSFHITTAAIAAENRKFRKL